MLFEIGPVKEDPCPMPLRSLLAEGRGPSISAGSLFDASEETPSGLGRWRLKRFRKIIAIRLEWQSLTALNGWTESQRTQYSNNDSSFFHSVQQKILDNGFRFANVFQGRASDQSPRLRYFLTIIIAAFYARRNMNLLNRDLSMCSPHFLRPRER